MTVNVNSVVGGVSTSLRLLAGENPTRGFIGVVDGAGQYKQNIPASINERILQNAAGAAGDHIAKIFAVVRNNATAQLILRDGTTVALASTAVASATGTTLSVAGTPWAANQWVGKIVKILTGTGAGQHRKVNSNTTSQLTVDHSWAVTPDATSTFEIYDGIELLPFDTPVGVYGITPGINAVNAGGWRISTDAGVLVSLVTGSFS